MNVKMKTCMSGGKDTVYRPGKIVEVSDRVGKAWAADDLAVIVEDGPADHVHPSASETDEEVAAAEAAAREDSEENDEADNISSGTNNDLDESNNASGETATVSDETIETSGETNSQTDITKSNQEIIDQLSQAGMFDEAPVHKAPAVQAEVPVEDLKPEVETKTTTSKKPSSKTATKKKSKKK